MAVIGNPRSFHKKFKFIVEIDDVGHAGFQKCSELSVEVANVQYFEGGSLIPNKSPGRLTFADVTLERGATQDRDLFDWFQDVAITSSGLGLTDVYAAILPSLTFEPAIHVNYAETVLRIKDGLPKQKDFPAEVGGSGELLPE